jgi:hypothetical protein
MADKTQQTIKLIEAGDLKGGRHLLIKQLKSNPRDDAAWFWLAKTVETDELRRECLEEALKHNPENVLAQQALDKLAGRSKAPVNKWEFTGTAAPKTPAAKAESVRRQPKTALALLTLLLALAIIAVTYFSSREYLAYRSEGRVTSATGLKSTKQAGPAGDGEICSAKYQFMAYGTLHKSENTFPCSEWKRIDKTQQMQVEYLISHPDQNRCYPTPTKYEAITFLFMPAWRFWLTFSGDYSSTILARRMTL